MSRFPARRFTAALIAGAAAVAGTALAIATPSYAVACTSPVRYATTSNTLYLVSGISYTPTDILRYCPSAPLRLVDPATKTWELSADLILQNGATLVLHGNVAAAGAGDVNTLRLRSLASNNPTEVQSITANYGTIDADAVTVTSWDDAANAPDTDPNLPNGAPSGAQGRAFVRAQSFLDTGGVARESAMRIVNSTFTNLGFYAGESYGVSYKVEGCSHADADLPVCQAVHVTGAEINSNFIGNFMGTYTWGAYNMQFTGNNYAHNFMYGLDPHDVSRYLDIEHNHFSFNGDHGVICSQRCDHLTIDYNESDHNGMVPFTGPDPDNPGDPGQVHGIMIHRGVTDTEIAYNNIHDEPNGAGIAVFDTAGDSIHDNRISNAKYGLRLSVGSADNTLSNNTVLNSTQYGVYTFAGSDVPTYTTASGHPTGNVFTGNTFDGSGSNLIKLSESDDTVFTGNSFAHAGSGIMLASSARTHFQQNVVPAGQQFTLTGTAAEPSSLIIDNPAGLKFKLDQFSSVTTG